MHHGKMNKNAQTEEENQKFSLKLYLDSDPEVPFLNQ